MLYLGIFRLTFGKNHPRICWNKKLCSKKKKDLKSRTKNPLLRVFGLQFCKSIAIFEISTLEFVKK